MYHLPSSVSSAAVADPVGFRRDDATAHPQRRLEKKVDRFRLPAPRTRHIDIRLADRPSHRKFHLQSHRLRPISSQKELALGLDA